MDPGKRADAQMRKRVDRLENIVLAIAEKVRKMAQGQQHFEQSFNNLQRSITDLGRDLKAKIGDMVAAHDAADDDSFEDHATRLDELVNQVQNLGTGDNQATTSGASPTTTAGASTGDLPQGRSAQPKALEEPEGERDVVVKGRNMPD